MRNFLPRTHTYTHKHTHPLTYIRDEIKPGDGLALKKRFAMNEWMDKFSTNYIELLVVPTFISFCFACKMFPINFDTRLFVHFAKFIPGKFLQQIKKKRKKKKTLHNTQKRKQDKINKKTKQKHSGGSVRTDGFAFTHYLFGFHFYFKLSVLSSLYSPNLKLCHNHFKFDIRNMILSLLIKLATN